jgi:SAM-dependent methyltransferase
MTPADRWRDQLAAWAIPSEIIAAVVDSPWSVPTEVFARRADTSIAAPAGASYLRAREALGDGGTVLDVGCGAGAASLPLGAPITGVDVSSEMLAALAERAQRLGLELRTVEGRWPDVADETPVADVVVCHHVAYNVPELGPFATALTDHARRRVVIELTPHHPMTPLNPLWTALHGLDRPTGPTARDAVDVLREVGIVAAVETSPRPPRAEYTSFADMVAVTRRRLCLPPERDPDVAAELRRLGVDPEHPRDLAPPEDTLVTLWCDSSPNGGVWWQLCGPQWTLAISTCRGRSAGVAPG